jgi:hypothetical protein
MDRIDAHRDEYETWPFPIKDAVMSGQVLKGMDPTMVYVARGSPSERIDRGNGDEIWVYKTRAEGSSGGGSLLPSGTGISIGGSSPIYSGSGYPGSTYPGSIYPSSGIGISLPPIALGGGGSGGNSEPDENEEQVVFRNGHVSLGDKVK